MILSSEWQALMDAHARALPTPLYVLGVEAARAYADRRSENAPPGIPVHQVENLRIGAGQPSRIYRPGPEAGRAALVYFHGGGWAIGNVDIVDANCRTFCNEAGIIVVSVGYRLAPEHKFPAAANDACAALDWVFDQAGQLGIDPARIAVGGESAGANLAAVAALHARDGGKAVRFQLLVYPPVEAAVDRPSRIDNADMLPVTARDMDWFFDQYLASEADRVDPRFAPVNADSLQGLPPAFVISAEYDTLRDGAEHYARLMAEAGVEVIQKRYLGVGHSFFGMSGMLPQADEAVNDAVRNLRAYLVG